MEGCLPRMWGGRRELLRQPGAHPTLHVGPKMQAVSTHCQQQPAPSDLRVLGPQAKLPADLTLVLVFLPSPHIPFLQGLS